MPLEKRMLLAASPECRDANGKKLFVGNAVVYGKRSEPIYDYFREEFRPGAFGDHLRSNPDVIATVDHDSKLLLGRTASGTLRLDDSDAALAVECDYGDTSAARDLAVRLERGDVRGMSFIFDCVDDEWRFDESDKVRIRTVRSARLFEVSFVTFPCYPDTDAAMRSALRTLEERGEPFLADLRRRKLRLAEMS